MEFFLTILALHGPVLSACCATPYAHCAMQIGERKWFPMIPHDTSSILASSQMEEVKLWSSLHTAVSFLSVVRRSYLAKGCSYTMGRELASYEVLKEWSALPCFLESLELLESRALSVVSVSSEPFHWFSPSEGVSNCNKNFALPCFCGHEAHAYILLFSWFPWFYWCKTQECFVPEQFLTAPFALVI